MKNFNLALMFAVASFAAAPAAAQADSITVGGLVGSSLSVSVPTPSVLDLVPGTTAASSSAVSVVSTLPSWTMTIADANSGTGAGRLKLAAGSTFLTNPLQWRVGAGSFTALTGSPVTAATGALTAVKTIDFEQVLPSNEALTAGQVWALTAQVVVS